VVDVIDLGPHVLDALTRFRRFCAAHTHNSFPFSTSARRASTRSKGLAILLPALYPLR
jgi:hypothetical protein